MSKNEELIIYMKKRYPPVQSFKKLKSYAGSATQKREKEGVSKDKRFITPGDHGLFRSQEL
jgi:hypothetical protein